MSKETVINIAKKEIGVTEFPSGSNKVKYWDTYGYQMQGQPWCVAFLWWCFHEAGEALAFMGGAKTASCSILLRWYKEQGQTVSIDQCEPGDIAMLSFSINSSPEHCGLIIDKGKNWIQTIEGNTCSTIDGSQDNDGIVAIKIRYPKNIVGICHPLYKKEEKKDYEDNWAKEDIKWCIDNQYMKGYPDGTFQPDKSVTRAELATIIRRIKEG